MAGFRDGFNFHTLAATFFLYFAIFAPDIDFEKDLISNIPVTGQPQYKLLMALLARGG